VIISYFGNGGKKFSLGRKWQRCATLVATVLQYIVVTIVDFHRRRRPKHSLFFTRPENDLTQRRHDVIIFLPS